MTRLRSPAAGQIGGEDPPLIYGVIDAEDFTAHIWRRFRQSYPSIPVKPRYVEGFRDLALSFVADFRAQRSTADVLWQSEAVMIGEIAPYLTPFPEMRFKTSYPDDMLYPSKREPIMFTTHQLPNVIIYNSEKLREYEAPKGWLDLAHPRWRGSIVMEDPRSLETSTKPLSELSPQMGRQRWARFLRGLAANRPHFTRNMREAHRRVARGEYLVGIDYINDILAQSPDAPVKIAWPQEEPLGLPSGAGSKIGVSQNTANPTSAKLFVEWVLSPGGQAALADSFRPPALLSLEHPYGLSRVLPSGVRILPPNRHFLRNPKRWETKIRSFFPNP